MYNTTEQDLINNYAELAEMTKGHRHVIVANETVLMSVEDYNLCRDFLHEQYILKELENAQKEAETCEEWLSLDEVFGKFREKYRYGACLDVQ